MEYNNYNIYGEIGIRQWYKYGLLYSITVDNFKMGKETIHEIGTMELSYRDMDSSRFSRLYPLVNYNSNANSQ